MLPDKIGSPENLSSSHDLSGFDSGEPLLDDWLRRRAERNEASGGLPNVRGRRASHVLVSLDSPDGRMELTIHDDGAGFDTNQDSRGMGTANMRARAEQLGGRLECVSSREAGTTVMFSIPCGDIATSPSPSRYRNRTIALVLLLLTSA